MSKKLLMSSISNLDGRETLEIAVKIKRQPAKMNVLYDGLINN